MKRPQGDSQRGVGGKTRAPREEAGLGGRVVWRGKTGRRPEAEGREGAREK